jgi:dGTPase
LDEEISKHSYLSTSLGRIKAKLDSSQKGTQGYSETLAAEFRIAAIAVMVIAAKNAFADSYDSILDGTFKQPLIKVSAAASLNKKCKDIARQHMFTNAVVVRRELMGRKIIHDLMDFYWPAIREKQNSVQLDHFLRKKYELISPNYRAVFERCLSGDGAGPSLPIEYRRMQLLTDQISGMTDSFAVQLHKQLFNA